jgi:hypothetical protein
MARTTDKQFFSVAWGALGYICQFRAFIIATDIDHANIMWKDYLKKHEYEAHTWHEAVHSCVGYANIKRVIGGNREFKDFKKVYPRKSKVAVYPMESLRFNKNNELIYE